MVQDILLRFLFHPDMPQIVQLLSYIIWHVSPLFLLQMFSLIPDEMYLLLQEQSTFQSTPHPSFLFQMLRCRWLHILLRQLSLSHDNNTLYEASIQHPVSHHFVSNLLLLFYIKFLQNLSTH